MHEFNGFFTCLQMRDRMKRKHKSIINCQNVVKTYLLMSFLSFFVVVANGIIFYDF